MRSDIDSASEGALGAVRTALFLAIAALAYIAATLLTEWVFIGDAPDYARASAARLFGVDCEFLEFGHLAWRPLGTVLVDVFVAPREGDTFRVLSLNALQQLNGAAWTLGLVGVVSAAAWLLNSVRSYSAAAFGVALLIACKAYLNFSQVGAPYVPGLGLLLAGLFLASLEPKGTPGRVIADVLAGICFGASALFWGTFALALPGAVLAPLALKPDWKRQLPRVALTGVIGVATLCIVYFAVGRAMGFDTLDDYRNWISAASHGISTGGVPRAAIGLARSFVDVGDYGQLVKRFLMRDATHPVSVRELFTLDLARIAIFYITMLALLVAALRGAIGRRALVVFVLVALPVLGFAVMWQGGDLERYLPGMPALVLLAAAAFREARGRPVLQSTMLVGLAVFAASNAVAMSNSIVERQGVAISQRLGSPDPASLARRVYLVSHFQEDLMAFNRNRPFHEMNLRGLNVFALVTPGTPDVANWREATARRILSAWKKGDEVYLSSRLLAPSPQPAWKWVEGDDPRVSWLDFGTFFRSLDLSSTRPGDAEFSLLEPSPANRAALETVAARIKPRAKDGAERMEGACVVPNENWTPSSS